VAKIKFDECLCCFNPSNTHFWVGKQLSLSSLAIVQERIREREDQKGKGINPDMHLSIGAYQLQNIL